MRPMPYDWTRPPSDQDGELHLWPHQSLQPEGYVRFLGVTAALITVPLLPLMGTPLFWALIPFLTLAVFGMKYALDQNRRLLGFPLEWFTHDFSATLKMMVATHMNLYGFSKG